jgi:hypothetical protein
MTDKKLTRRGLLSLFGVPSKPAAPAAGFSLSAFYAGRARRSEATGDALPSVPLRPGLPDVRDHATTVGVPELGARVKVPPAPVLDPDADEGDDVA